MKAFMVAVALVSFTGGASAEVSIIDNHVAMTIDCAKDPVVSVLGNHAKLTLTGVCKQVMIVGNHARVTGSVGALSMPGNHNQAMLDAVDAISVPGNYNTITYKQTVTPKKRAPRITNPGHKNSVKKTT